jgi:murein DD-endopeptidase MepM/ murein hydrolase activator NlpD
MFPTYYDQCPEGNSYIVQAGDTLYAISRFYNISLDDLIEFNTEIYPELLTQGQIICIPPAAAPANCPTGAATYVVQKRDSL